VGLIHVSTAFPEDIQIPMRKDDEELNSFGMEQSPCKHPEPVLAARYYPEELLY
jgi:hypothetical protein